MSYRRKGSKFWWISFTNAEGKLIRESSKHTGKAQADIVERNYRQQRAFNVHGLADPTVNQKMTFGELVEWWRVSYGEKLQSSTIIGSIEKHLLPRFGAMKLSEIHGSEFEIFMKGMVPEYMPRTPNSLRDVTRRIFNCAIKARKYFGPNPMKDVEALEVNESVSDYLELDEVGPFLAALTGQYRLVCATGLLTAMRLGELYGLRKQDLNWKSMEITVRKSWGHDTTKARKDLVIPIIPDLVPYLRAAVDSSDSLLVFPGPKGAMRSVNTNINERIATALKRAGLIIGYDHLCRTCGTKARNTSAEITRCDDCGHKHLVLPVPREITVHKLRHTTGTLLSKAGVPIQTIQKILGHSDIKVTAKHYQHLNTRDQRQAMEQNLVFQNLPEPEAEILFTFSAQSAGSGKDEGRDAPVSRETSRPSESGRQDLNLRPLGPEGPQADPHGVAPGGTASYPFDNTRNATDAGFHPVAPFPPDETPFGALVVQELPGPLLTVGEVAARLRVSRATVYRLVRLGTLPALRVSNAIRIPADAFAS